MAPPDRSLPGFESFASAQLAAIPKDKNQYTQERALPALRTASVLPKWTPARFSGRRAQPHVGSAIPKGPCLRLWPAAYSAQLIVVAGREDGGFAALTGL